MDDKQVNPSAVRGALDDCLSGVSALPALRHDILRKARGEIKVKKKLSLALILAIVLIMAAVTALAVATLQEMARHAAKTEREEGFFANWTLEQKVKLVNSLAELGYIEKTGEMERLAAGGMPEDEAHSAADRIVAAYTGREAGEVGFLSIMQVSMGPVDAWTHEQKAWYSRLMAEVGVKTEGRTFYLEPGGAIDEAQAVAIAKREVAGGFGVPESALDAYQLRVDFEIPEANEPGDRQAWWHVEFMAPEGMGEKERLFHSFPVFVHPETGGLMRTVEEMLAPPLYLRPDNSLYQAIGALYDEAGKRGVYSFRTWPLALKARYSQEIRPRVQEILRSGDLSQLMNAGQPDREVIAAASFVYGLPGKGDIPQAEAFALAKEALTRQFGTAPAVFDLYSEEIAYFDVSDPERPLWKFLFNAGALPRDGLEGGLKNPLKDVCYKAELDARTGRAVKLEEFLFRVADRSLTDDLKWH